MPLPNFHIKRDTTQKDIPVDNDEVSLRTAALWQEIDRAAEIQDTEQRARAIETVATKLAVETGRTAIAPLFFLLGYAWYFHPSRLTSAVVQEKLESALRSALEVDPGYARAHMYLGHEAFDLRKYEQARSHFEMVDLSQLGSYWAMKVREMRVCCGIATEGLAQSLNLLDEYVQIAEQHSPPDVWPTELHKWVEAEGASLVEVDQQRLRQLLERLDRAERFRK